MEIAKSSLDVQLPAEQAHVKWLEWAGGTAGTGRTPTGTLVTEYLPQRKLPHSLSGVDDGTCYFQSDNGTTRITMELRRNRRRKQAMSDWMLLRIKAHLRRFKHFAEGRGSQRLKRTPPIARRPLSRSA